jgi:hypothetical protein
MNKLDLSQKKRVSPLSEINDDGFIIGIHNFCDRWCVHCRFTAHCRVFEMDMDYKRRNPGKGSDLQSVFEQVGEVLSTTLELLKKMAEEKGIDLSEIEPEDTQKPLWPDHPIMSLSKKYSNDLHDWLKAKSEMIELEIAEVALHDFEKAELMSDAYDNIGWFCFFISVKFARALPEDDGEDEFLIYHRLGTVKVATIATERSMAALTFLLQHFTEEEDTLLALLVLLEKIRRLSAVQFPNAMEFIRPGLDEY